MAKPKPRLISLTVLEDGAAVLDIGDISVALTAKEYEILGPLMAPRTKPRRITPEPSAFAIEDVARMAASTWANEHVKSFADPHKFGQEVMRAWDACMSPPPDAKGPAHD